MKVIVAGSRTITDPTIVANAISGSSFQITEIVSGGAAGVDMLGETWALENSIPVSRFPADWKKFGKKAGIIRNKHMAEYANALIAIWDGTSKGTGNMIATAQVLKLKVYIYKVEKSSKEIDETFT